MLVKFHLDSVMFNEKVWHGNFSSLEEEPLAAGGPPPPSVACTAWVWVVRSVTITRSQVGVPNGVLKVQSSTEQVRGVGGAMALIIT